jgi:hypothetical protein
MACKWWTWSKLSLAPSRIAQSDKLNFQDQLTKSESFSLFKIFFFNSSKFDFSSNTGQKKGASSDTGEKKGAFLDTGEKKGASSDIGEQNILSNGEGGFAV